MKNIFLYKVVASAVMTLTFSSVVQAQANNARAANDVEKSSSDTSGVHFFIGQRVWLATWDQAYFDAQLVVPNPLNPVPVLREFNQHALSDTTVLPLTALGLRYKDLTVSATFLPQTKFSSGGLAVGDTVRRDEADLSVSYAFAPSLSASVIYKTGAIDQGATANSTNLTGVSGSYKIDGLLIGFSANASIKGPLALYGNFAFGPAKETVSFSGGDTQIYHGTYQISEIGLAYRLTDERAFLGFKNLSVQLGYRSQSVVINDLPFNTWSVGGVPAKISSESISVQSSTQGLVFGVTAAF